MTCILKRALSPVFCIAAVTVCILPHRLLAQDGRFSENAARLQPFTLTAKYEPALAANPHLAQETVATDEFVKKRLPVARVVTNWGVIFLDESHRRYVKVRVEAPTDVNLDTLYLIPSATTTASQRVVDYLFRMAAVSNQKEMIVKW